MKSPRWFGGRSAPPINSLAERPSGLNSGHSAPAWVIRCLPPVVHNRPAPALSPMDLRLAEHVDEERQHAAWLIVLESRLSWPIGLAG